MERRLSKNRYSTQAIWAVVLVAGLLAANGIGCNESGGGGGGGAATCQTAFTRWHRTCGEWFEELSGETYTSQQAVEDCNEDQAEAETLGCTAEFTAMLSCENRTTETYCETRCGDEWEDLFACMNPCDACLYANCSAEDEACGNNAECLALFGCLLECDVDDQPCIDACVTAHPEGGADLQAYFDCFGANCEEECADEG